MITFPNAKINLGLNITEKRPDGYHNLETVFYPVPIEDALEIHVQNNCQLPAANGQVQKFSLHQAGLEITGNAADNLVVKAYLMLDKVFDLPPVDIHLYKHIPSGAGLGGGSSDAAFMLKLLNKVRTGTNHRKTGRICCSVRSRLCFLYQQYANLCRRNRKPILSYHAFFKRLSDPIGKTRYFCIYARSFFTD